MSRRSLKNPDYQVRYISKGKAPHENYARIYRSLFYSDRFLKLSPTAKLIYQAILLECKNGKRTCCTFPHSAYSKLTTKASFHKAKRELIENGFITEACFKTKACIYYLSDDWKLEVIPDREPEYHDISEYDRLLKGIKE